MPRMFRNHKKLKGGRKMKPNDWILYFPQYHILILILVLVCLFFIIRTWIIVRSENGIILFSPEHQIHFEGGVKMSHHRKPFKPKRKDGISKHHRKCRSNGGTDDESNISLIPILNHNSWHQLTQNYDPQKIADIFNEFYLDPDYKFVVIPTSAFTGVNHIDNFKTAHIPHH